MELGAIIWYLRSTFRLFCHSVPKRIQKLLKSHPKQKVTHLKEVPCIIHCMKEENIVLPLKSWQSPKREIINRASFFNFRKPWKVCGKVVSQWVGFIGQKRKFWGWKIVSIGLVHCTINVVNTNRSWYVNFLGSPAPNCLHRMLPVCQLYVVSQLTWDLGCYYLFSINFKALLWQFVTHWESKAIRILLCQQHKAKLGC